MRNNIRKSRVASLFNVIANTHRRRRRDSTVALSRVGGVHLNSQLVHDGFGRRLEDYWKPNMLRINPVELAAELETGSRLPTGECTRRPTQFNSTQRVQYSIFLSNPLAVVVS